MNRKYLLFLIACITAGVCRAQDDAACNTFLHHEIDALTDTAMHGRGYVKNGVGIASAYLQQRFSEIGLQKPGRKKNYTQPYSFPVNTFPDQMLLVINGDTLQAGADYIVDAADSSCFKDNMPLVTIDMTTVASNDAWEKMQTTFSARKGIYYLKNLDSAIKFLDIRKNGLAGSLPRGYYIIPEKKKLTWDVARDQNEATVFYVKEEKMTTDSGTVTVHLHADLQPSYTCDNIIGYVPGEVQDSFVAFTAHYDHLGMMGSDAMFPGASDNASGTAMLLYLATYFAAHPQHYSMLFIAFSGEEAGLLGSKYYVGHQVVLDGRIKFLTNLDIMGDATDGVTVVNATEFPEQFATLQQINKEKHYLPDVKSRGRAANSDHYFFTEDGVSSFFLYSDGGKGYYHDIYDKANTLSLQNIAQVAQLLIDFTDTIR